MTEIFLRYRFAWDYTRAFDDQILFIVLKALHFPPYWLGVTLTFLKVIDLRSLLIRHSCSLQGGGSQLIQNSPCSQGFVHFVPQWELVPSSVLRMMHQSPPLWDQPEHETGLQGKNMTAELCCQKKPNSFEQFPFCNRDTSEWNISWFILLPKAEITEKSKDKSAWGYG